MEIHATLAGVFASAVLGIGVVYLAFLSRRIAPQSPIGRTVLLLAMSVLALYLLAGFLVYLAERVGVRLTQLGHAATNFVLPFLGVALVFVIVAGIVAATPVRRIKSTRFFPDTDA